MTTGDVTQLSSCGCCEGVPSPNAIDNRSGLPALSYRVGTYGMFFQRMLDEIYTAPVPANPGQPTPLAALKTRSSSDPSIALLDAWAVVADVLTFYQERIANEGFLRTAIERRSILELAREIGYELSPGVAASAYLQFTVEEIIGTKSNTGIARTQTAAGPGSSPYNSGIVSVPAGTQVQSVPAPGQLPQTFETSADFEARVEWNAMRPRLSRPQDLVIYQNNLYLLDRFEGFVSSNQKIAGQPVTLGNVVQSAQISDGTDVYFLNPAGLNALLPATFALVQISEIVLQGTKTGIQIGDRILLIGYRNTGIPNQQAGVFAVQHVETDSNLGTTTVQIGDTPQWPSLGSNTAASINLMLNASQPNLTAILFNQDNVNKYIRANDIDESDLQAFLKTNNWDAENLVTAVNAPQTALTDGGTGNNFGVFSFGATAAFFGHNAPLWASLPNPTPNKPMSPSTPLPAPPQIVIFTLPPILNLSSVQASSTSSPDPPLPQPFQSATIYQNSWDTSDGFLPTIWTDSQGNVYDSDFFNSSIAFLERSFPQILPNSWAFLEAIGPAQLNQQTSPPRSTVFQISGVFEQSLADYSLSGKSTGLRIQVPMSDSPSFKVRTTRAFVQSQQLSLAEIPIVDDIPANTTEIMLNEMVIGLVPNQPVMLSGVRSDATGVSASEIVFIQEIVHIRGFTTLTFTKGLQYSYLRSSLTLSANVTLGTHGATVNEVLGSGDGSQTNQTFVLKRPPLTYTSATTPNGIASSLAIRVNGLEWQEVPTLYGRSASDKNYIVRLADDGTVSVTFGNPASRLKTGQQNVSSVYRTGIGLAGNVAAGSLSMLLSRPPGLRSVINPLAASGAADPQKLADARSNAPLTVLTLDRIVSLDDYESFVQAFAGVGKAQAVTVWSGEERLVHITVAAADGQPIDTSSPLYSTLVQAIAQANDPVQNFIVSGYVPLLFNLKAGLLLDTPTYDSTAVMAQVQTALADTFSFANRAFAQAVTAAEVVTRIQSIPGIIAVYLTQLYLFDDVNGPLQTEPSSVLAARPAYWQAGNIQPAQLLLLNPLGVTLTEVTS